MVWWMALQLAVAAVPTGVVPQLAPIDAPEGWKDYVKSAHLPATELACEPAWPDVALVCFKIRENGKRRWVTSADLAAWKVDTAGLRASLLAGARAALAGQPVPTKVDGGPQLYWQAAEGDGWSAAGILMPELVADKLATKVFYAAIPTGEATLFWRPGDADLDRIMAVGVKEMFQAADSGVTPVVYQWSGGLWTPFMEAKVADPPKK